MSDKDGKTPLGLGGGNRPGAVKQSFSHGRTKSVVVETKRKRVVVPKPGAAGAELASGVGTLDDARAKEDPQAAGLAAWSLVHGFAMLWLNDVIDTDTDAVETARRVARMLFTPGPVEPGGDE